MRSNAGYFVRPWNAAGLEQLVRADFERAHPGETFADVRRRAAFCKEDKGLYRDWLALAAARAEAVYAAMRIAAE
jgi:hypothetical protein